MQPPTDEEPIQVLHIDDDRSFLKSAKKCLNLQGDFVIESASSVDEAFEKMTKKKPDVIICDVNMPGTDGFEFLKALRESNYNVPFIVFTVTGDKETARKAFNAGANGFVGKSGETKVVFSLLKEQIEKAVNDSGEMKNL
ncbi:MAG: response regulator [Candidatus Bathyarchaeum sp.]|nr:MAG: response regulator [Candidatus Bathyarchaeum sp.]